MFIYYELFPIVTKTKKFARKKHVKDMLCTSVKLRNSKNSTRVPMQEFSHEEFISSIQEFIW